MAFSFGRFHQIIREQLVRVHEEHDVLREVLDAAKYRLKEGPRRLAARRSDAAGHCIGSAGR